MQTPTLNDGQFGSAANFSAAFALLTAGIAQANSAMHTPGISYPGLFGITESGLTITVTATAPFGVGPSILFGNGVLAQMLGTTAGTVTSSATVNLASLVPGSGSVVAYVVASAAQVSQQGLPVVGPPSGHPDYNPSFAPYTGYGAVDDTLVLTATTTAPDNEVYVEICRTTLTAGQVTITTVDTSHQQLVGALLSQNGEVVLADLAAAVLATFLHTANVVPPQETYSGEGVSIGPGYSGNLTRSFTAPCAGYVIARAGINFGLAAGNITTSLSNNINSTTSADATNASQYHEIVFPVSAGAAVTVTYTVTGSSGTWSPPATATYRLGFQFQPSA